MNKFDPYFLRLIRDEGSIQPGRVAAMSALAGLSSAAVLGIVNTAAEAASRSETTTGYFFAFLGVTLVFVLAKRFILLSSIRETEQIIHRIRLRIVDKLLRSDLLALDRIGHANILASVGKDTQILSQAAFMVTNASEALAMLIFAMVYLAWLSLPAFLVGGAFVGIAVLIHFAKMSRVDEGLRDAMARENACLGTINDFLAGFKEIKLNSRRADDLAQHLGTESRLAARSKTDALQMLARHFSLTQAMLYMLVATMVFVVPIFSDTFSNVVVKTATTVLFMVSSITILVAAIPVFAEANAAAGHIRTIEKELNDTCWPADPGGGPPPAGRFREITLHQVSYRHERPGDDHPFTLGPIDLTLRAGELVFVKGGNGSGKSTLIKLLVGLYRPTAGVIRVDGRDIDHHSLAAYRDQFAVVFSDYHLFKRLYGMMETAQDRIDALLVGLEMDKKTGVTNGEFATLDLSSGQRKRIALMVALLEDKPIVVLDEWAADQDPYFREKFYREILPELKRLGKTVIAVTHDDRYFDIADRRISLEYGRIANDDREYAHG